MPNLILILLKNDYFVEKNLNLLNRRFSTEFWYAKNQSSAFKTRWARLFCLSFRGYFVGSFCGANRNPILYFYLTITIY